MKNPDLRVRLIPKGDWWFLEYLEGDKEFYAEIYGVDSVEDLDNKDLRILHGNSPEDAIKFIDEIFAVNDCRISKAGSLKAPMYRVWRKDIALPQPDASEKDTLDILPNAYLVRLPDALWAELDTMKAYYPDMVIAIETAIKGTTGPVAVYTIPLTQGLFEGRIIAKKGTFNLTLCFLSQPLTDFSDSGKALDDARVWMEKEGHGFKDKYPITYQKTLDVDADGKDTKWIMGYITKEACIAMAAHNKVMASIMDMLAPDTDSEMDSLDAELGDMDVEQGADPPSET